MEGRREERRERESMRKRERREKGEREIRERLQQEEGRKRKVKLKGRERAKWTRLYKIKKQTRADNLCGVIASNYSLAFLEGRWGRGGFRLKGDFIHPDQLCYRPLLFLDINLKKKKKKKKEVRCNVFTPMNPPLGRE